MTADDPVLSSPHPESPRPTKESMGELVRNYGVAEYNCGEWNGNPAGRGLFREAQTRMTATRAALLSAIDQTESENAELRDQRNEYCRERDELAEDFNHLCTENLSLKQQISRLQSHLDTPGVRVSEKEIEALREIAKAAESLDWWVHSPGAVNNQMLEAIGAVSGVHGNHLVELHEVLQRHAGVLAP